MERKRIWAVLLMLLLWGAALSACKAEKATKWVPVRSETETEPAFRMTEQQDSTALPTQPAAQQEPDTAEASVATAGLETDAPAATTVEPVPETSSAAMTEATADQPERSAHIAAEETEAETATEEPEVNYIANTNTKKFHLPDCSSVKDMKEENKWLFSGIRDALIEQGYQPCKRCNP